MKIKASKEIGDYLVRLIEDDGKHEVEVLKDGERQHHASFETPNGAAVIYRECKQQLAALYN